MTRYSILRVKENLFCVLEGGVIIYSCATLESAKKHVDRLEYQDLMKEMMTYQ